MGKNVTVHFHIYTVPVTSISTFSPFTSSEMTPLPRSPAASSWDLQTKLSLSSFSHRRPPWGFHWQNLAADFGGDTWRHTDSRVALPELDELCKLSWVETYFHWDCQQGGDAKTQGVLSVRIFFFLIPNCRFSVRPLLFPKHMWLGGKLPYLWLYNFIVL